MLTRSLAAADRKDGNHEVSSAARSPAVVVGRRPGTEDG
jgi:hypothetical protein